MQNFLNSGLGLAVFFSPSALQAEGVPKECTTFFYLHAMCRFVIIIHTVCPAYL